jgi:hypothetical protein
MAKASDYNIVTFQRKPGRRRANETPIFPAATRRQGTTILGFFLRPKIAAPKKVLPLRQIKLLRHWSRSRHGCGLTCLLWSMRQSSPAHRNSHDAILCQCKKSEVFLGKSKQDQPFLAFICSLHLYRHDADLPQCLEFLETQGIRHEVYHGYLPAASLDGWSFKLSRLRPPLSILVHEPRGDVRTR